MADEIKKGSRHSAKDQQLVQEIHDRALELGAQSPGIMGQIGTPMPMKMDEETVVAFGAELKALGDGKVGGYLVRFSSEDDPDLVGDYFTKDTDFGEVTKLPVLYHHGLDATLKRRRIGTADIKADDSGLWLEAQLNLRDAYEKAIYQMVEKKKQGLSSGAASHTVTRAKGAKAAHITQWYIAEASITPTPAEPRNEVQSLKSLSTTEIELPEADAEAGNRANAAEKATVNTFTNVTASFTAQDSARVSAGSEVKQMTPEEKKALREEFEAELKAQAEAKAAQQAEIKAAVEAALKAAPALKTGAYLDGKAPAFLRTIDGGNIKAYDRAAFEPYKDSDEIKAFMHYLETGEGATKASNAVAMQEGTPGEGGYAVPTPLYNAIIAKKSEVSLREKLGLRRIPGKGLTVNVATDNEADGEFVSTAEEQTTDLDSPAIGTLAMTLVKYTKRIVMSWELLEDEDVNLLSFIADWVGRGAAKTENTLLLAAVAADGTAFTPFAAGAALAFGEVEAAIWNSTIPYYLDDGGSNAWVMRASTWLALSKITSVDRAYAQYPQGNGAAARPMLLGYPVYFSEKAAAVGTSAKPIYFGNWNYVGYREAPGMTVIRDPYSMAITGQVVYHYYFRQVYKVLQAGAIGYQANPSA